MATVAWTGDGLTFGSPSSLDTTVSAAASGTYEASVTYDDGENPPTSDVVQVIAVGVTVLWTSPDGLVFDDPGSLSPTATAGFSFNHRADVTVDDGVNQPSSDTVIVTTPVGFGRTLPDLDVEIDGRGTPHAWTEPSSWVRINGENGIRSLNIVRGQEETYGPVQPGELLLVLSNNNGFLDPTFSVSPFAGLLTVGRQLRLVHVPTGDVVFRGNVASWPIQFLQANDSTTELLVLDLLALAGATRLPESLVEHELALGERYPRPSYCWTLKEDVAAEDIVFADMFEGPGGLPKGSASAAGQQLVPFAPWTGVGGSGHLNGGYVVVSGARIDRKKDFTVAAVASCPADETSLSLGIGLTTDTELLLGLGSTTLFGADPAKVHPVILTQLTDGTTDGIVRESSIGDDGRPHLLMGTYDVSSAAYTLGFDKVRSSGSAGGALSNSDYYLVLNVGSIGAGTALVCVWRLVVTFTQQQALYDDIFRPWVGDRVVARMGKLITLAMPGLAQDLGSDVGTGLFLPVRFDGLPLLDLLRRAAMSVDGRLWASRDGTLVCRPYGTHNVSSVASYGPGGSPVRDLAVTDAHEDVLTEVLLKNEAGSTKSYQDGAAATARGNRRGEIDGLMLKEPTELKTLAVRLVERRKDPQPYVYSIVLAPADGDVGVGPTLALDIYDRIAVSWTRPWGGALVTEDAEIIGIEHSGDAGGGEFTTRLRLRPWQA